MDVCSEHRSYSEDYRACPFCEINRLIADLVELETQLAKEKEMSDLHKAVYDLVVKERDLARYQLAKAETVTLDKLEAVR
jgi:hypothetical protein